MVDPALVSAIEGRAQDADIQTGEDADRAQKLVSDIIMLDAKDYYSNMSKNAEEKKNIAELALIFSLTVDDEEFSNLLTARTKKIDEFKKTASDTNLDSILADISHGLSESEQQVQKQRHQERLDATIADITYACIRNEQLYTILWTTKFHFHFFWK